MKLRTDCGTENGVMAAMQCTFQQMVKQRINKNCLRRSWVRFPPRSKDFFFASCGSLFPFIRANALWVIHGFK